MEIKNKDVCYSKDESEELQIWRVLFLAYWSVFTNMVTYGLNFHSCLY